MKPNVVCLTKTQMAAVLQVSVRTINGMMARGDIAYFRIRPRLVRFPVDEALKRMGETVLVRED
jgi:excisionase family DNA binding protein